jgi:hypothetical protein
MIVWAKGGIRMFSKAILSSVLFLGLFTQIQAQDNTKRIDITLPFSLNNTYLLPMPNRVLALDSDISLVLNGSQIDARVFSKLLWPSIDKPQFVRLLVIEFKQAPQGRDILQIHWGKGNKPLRRYFASTENTTLISPNMAWLREAILLQPTSSDTMSWYVDAQRLHAAYVSDEAQMAQKKYPLQQPSQWLYDKPKALSQLYLLSEDERVLDWSKKYAQFYASNIDEDGYFALTKYQDIKYSNSVGLLYNYLLSGDRLYESTIYRIYAASTKWDAAYELGRGFWTERNQAAALNSAISEWELTNSQGAHTRIVDIIDETYQMTFWPVNDWPLRNCPQHTIKSHEGKGGNSPVCSPWMMALLSDALWRYYLLSDDVKSASLISAFTDFFVQHGSYNELRKGKEIVAPFYLVAFERAELVERNVWTDPQHNCDLAGMLGKGLYIKTKTNSDVQAAKKTFKIFANMCRQDLETVTKRYKKKGQAPLKPPRRFGWTYSSTSDLPWLADMFLN